MLISLILLIVVGCLSIAIIMFDVFSKLNNGGGVKNVLFTLTPAPDGNSPRKTAMRMVRAPCMDHFPMHILTNKAPKFNDRVSLKRYKAYIRNPLAIAYIKGVEGRDENE